MTSMSAATPLVERLRELAGLRDGWLDGEGHAPPAAGLQWLADAWTAHLQPHCAAPFAYPTVEGGIGLEWGTPQHGVSLEVNLPSREVQLLVVGLDTAPPNFDKGWAFAGLSPEDANAQWRDIAALLRTVLA